MQSVSVEQTVSLAMDHFMTKQFVTLVAPMQSGKTTTYFAVATEALNRGIVKQIVIFSGNREKMLRDQTLARVRTDETLKDVTDVVWGPDLKKYRANIMIDTLYIWDESHFGQSSDQEVDRFCAKCGICPAGMDSLPGVYCLSVSATPFSEVVDSNELETKKLVIFQKPGKSYYGIKQMLRNGRIRTFTDYSVKMDELVYKLSKSKVPKIGMFRLREDGKGENKLSILKSLSLKYNIPCALYDKDVLDEDLSKAIETKPTRSHIVIVKGKLKMGKTINDKRHVLFCMETAKSSNSDTLLQGLMGRFCGYESNPETTFYIHTNNIDGPTEYVNYFKTLGSKSPSSGMNIVYGSRAVLEYAKVEKLNVSVKDTGVILREVAKKKDWVNDESAIAILKQIPQNGYKFKIWKSDKPIKEGIVPPIYAGHGGLEIGRAANFYILKDCVYLVFSIGKLTPVVTTTKKEIFSTRLKTLYQNGYVIGGPRIESFSNETEMLPDIHKLIRATKMTEGLLERKIQNSVGVRMSVNVFRSLQSNGMIYRKLLEYEGVHIKTGRIISQDESYVIVQDVTW
jgi:hypothetical protein